MNIAELVHEATGFGSSIGQTSLAEFILRDYGHELSPELKRFLQKISANGCSNIADNLGKPAEDVALEVDRMMGASRTK